MASSKSYSRRSKRVRFQIAQKSDRLRLSVFRSNKHISAQLIDDNQGKTLVSASTYEKEIRDALKNAGATIDAAKLVGSKIAERAVKAGAATVVFDRGAYRYHGRVKELADAARASGLSF